MLIESIARVGATCEALVRLPQYVREWGMNKAAREVARSLCGYLDGALDLHRNVQEESLFPALLDSAQNADGLSALVARFMAEHRRLEIAWRALRPSLAAVALCRPATLSIDEATRLAAIYREHADAEVRHLLALTSTTSRVAGRLSTVVSHRGCAAYGRRLVDTSE